MFSPSDRGVPESLSPTRQGCAEDLSDRLWDAVVVGAGPAGSAAAYHLARSGWSTLLLDRARFPREKVCGDCLMPDAEAALQRMGLLPKIETAGTAFASARITSPAGHSVDVPGRFLSFRRQALDMLLADRASCAGARFALGHVEKVFPGAEGRALLHLRGTQVQLQARSAILATGARGAFPLGTGSRPPGAPSSLATGVRCYLRSDLDLSRPVFCYRRELLPGYAWIVPLGSGLFNVGCGIFHQHRDGTRVNLARTLRAFVVEHPDARRLFPLGAERARVGGALLRCGPASAPPVGPGSILAAGEAIGSTYPLSGEGIGPALETGEMAAAAVEEFLRSGDARSLAGYAQNIDRLRRRQRRFRRAEWWVSGPRRADLLVRRAQSSALLRSAGSGILLQGEDPRRVFSLYGLVRSLVS